MKMQHSINDKLEQYPNAQVYTNVQNQKQNHTELDGSDLTIESLQSIAQGTQVDIDQKALDRMSETNALILDAAKSGKAVYGVTTALGPQVTITLTDEAINEFAIKTVRGRAHALGKPLDRRVVRAAMAVRLNSLLTGASGASPAIAVHLQQCLNANLIPHIGETASVGAADLLWGGSMGLALIGEGKFLNDEKGAATALSDAGIPKLALGPRDGLALVSHSSFTSGLASVGLFAAKTLWRNAQLAAAMTLEGFRGNLSPFDADVLKTREQPGQLDSADDIRALLEGSALHDLSNARRLQDPLSIRNTVQVHGSVYATLELLAETIEQEINGASDNPIVLPDRGAILSAGGYLHPHLATLLVAANHSLVQLAAQSVSRSARMMSSRFTDLPIGLHAGTTGSVGLGAVTKVTEALFAEIAQLAAPPMVYPPSQADNVEDCITNAAVSAKALIAIVEKLNLIVAFEMIAAVHAIYLRMTELEVGAALRPVIERIRLLSPALEHDRSITVELESLALDLMQDEFSFVRS